MKPLSPKTLERKYAELGLSKAKIDLLRNYFLCFANLYGMLEVREAWDVFKHYEGNKIRKKDFIAFSGIVQREPDLPFSVLELNEVFTDEPAGKPDMRLIVNNDLIGLGYGKYEQIYRLSDVAVDKPLWLPDSKDELFEFHIDRKTTRLKANACQILCFTRILNSLRLIITKANRRKKPCGNCLRKLH